MEEPGSPGDTGRRTGIRVVASLVVIVTVGLIASFASGCGDDSGDSSTRAPAGNSTNSSASEATNNSKRNFGPPTDDSSPPSPELVTVDSLRETAEKQKTPIYWAGERPGTKLALSPLTRGSLGGTFVRYLTGGAKAEDPRAIFLTVVTDISSNPVARLRSLAEASGDAVGKTPGGASIYYDHSQPESIYLAFPGVDAQIEVFYPGHFKQSLDLVNSGRIVPVG